MKKILKLTLILCLICAVVAGVLGVVNELTHDKIIERQEEKTRTAYSKVLPSDGYTEIEGLDIPTIDKISECAEGWVVETSFSGAQSTVTMAVGVDREYKCTGIYIIKHGETSGLGAKAAAQNPEGDEWRAQFEGEDENVKILKEGGNINAITGATITSRAVSKAVATSIEAVKSLG